MTNGDRCSSVATNFVEEMIYSNEWNFVAIASGLEEMKYTEKIAAVKHENCQLIVGSRWTFRNLLVPLSAVSG